MSTAGISIPTLVQHTPRLVLALWALGVAASAAGWWLTGGAILSSTVALVLLARTRQALLQVELGAAMSGSALVVVLVPPARSWIGLASLGPASGWMLLAAAAAVYFLGLLIGLLGWAYTARAGNGERYRPDLALGWLTPPLVAVGVIITGF